MSSETPSLPPKQPRRTWRQWSKLARVRIGFVLMLIVAISVFTWWLPRRGVVAVAWIGGRVGDPQIVDQVQIAGRNLPVSIQAILWPWLEPRMSWLSIDERIVSVDLSQVQSPQLDLVVLRRFPRLTWVVFHGRHVGPGLKQMKGVNSLHSIAVDSVQSESDLGELRHFPNLEELDITTCPNSGGGFERLSLLPKLKKLLFDSPSSHIAMRGVSQCPAVKAIVLQGGSADEDDLRFLSDMASLIEFRTFGRNPVGVTGLRHIAKTSSLETLLLNPTSATDDELQVLGTLTKLKSFYVRGSNLTQSGIDRLKAALPDCKLDGPNHVE